MDAPQYNCVVHTWCIYKNPNNGARNRCDMCAEGHIGHFPLCAICRRRTGSDDNLCKVMCASSWKCNHIQPFSSCLDRHVNTNLTHFADVFGWHISKKNTTQTDMPSFIIIIRDETYRVWSQSRLRRSLMKTTLSYTLTHHHHQHNRPRMFVSDTLLISKSLAFARNNPAMIAQSCTALQFRNLIMENVERWEF